MADALVHVIQMIVIAALSLIGVDYAPDHQRSSAAIVVTTPRLASQRLEIAPPPAPLRFADANAKRPLAVMSARLVSYPQPTCRDVAPQPAIWRAAGRQSRRSYEL